MSLWVCMLFFQCEVYSRRVREAVVLLSHILFQSSLILFETVYGYNKSPGFDRHVVLFLTHLTIGGVGNLRLQPGPPSGHL